MLPLSELLAQLRAMMGKRVRLSVTTGVVVEILDQGPYLVIQPDHSATTIQPDSYGRPRRQTLELLTIPVLDSEKDAFHSDFMALELAPQDTPSTPYKYVYQLIK